MIIVMTLTILNQATLMDDIKSIFYKYKVNTGCGELCVPHNSA